MIKLKDILMETSVYAIPSGHGTKNTRFTSKTLGRPYHRKKLSGGESWPPEMPWSKFTPDEIEFLKNKSGKEKYNLLKKKRRDYIKAQGLCCYCGRNPVHTYEDGTKASQCKNCLDKNSLYKRNLVSKGLCRSCGKNPLHTYDDGTKAAKCKDCLEIAMIRRKNLLSQGLCVSCGKNPLHTHEDETKSEYCTNCLEKLRPLYKKYNDNFKNKNKPPIDYSIE